MAVELTPCRGPKEFVGTLATGRIWTQPSECLAVVVETLRPVALSVGRKRVNPPDTTRLGLPYIYMPIYADQVGRFWGSMSLWQPNLSQSHSSCGSFGLENQAFETLFGPHASRTTEEVTVRSAVRSSEPANQRQDRPGPPPAPS